MDYDQHAIDRAKQDKLFDDSFDPLALSISRDEKASISKDLRAARDELESKMPQSPDEAIEVKKKQKKSEQLSFFERLTRFFLMLFTGMKKEDYLKRKKLKKLRRDLKSIKPPLYNFKTQLVSSSLAKQVFSLFEYLMPYKNAFERVFEKNDEGESVLFEFQVMFLKIASTNAKIKNISQFSEKVLTTIIANGGENEVRGAIKDELEVFFHAFSEEERKRIDASYNEMLHVKDLLNFDYIAFLERFNRDFNAGNTKAVFRDAHPMGLVRLVKELNQVLLQINPAFVPQAFETARLFYKESMDKDDTATSRKEIFHGLMEKMSKDHYHAVIAAITKINQNDRLSLLIRYISREFKYQPYIARKRHEFFMEFSRNLRNSVESVLDKLFREKNKESINKKLFALLNIRELPSMYIYSDEKNEMLESIGVLAFRYPRALNFSMLFFQEKWFGYLKKVLNQLLVSANFRNNDLMKALSQEFYSMDDLFAQFSEYVSHVSAEHDRGQLLDTMITKHKSDPISRNAMNARIGTLNTELERLLNALGRSLLQLDDLLCNPETAAALKQTTEKEQALVKHFLKSKSDIAIARDILSNLIQSAEHKKS